VNYEEKPINEKSPARKSFLTRQTKLINEKVITKIITVLLKLHQCEKKMKNLSKMIFIG